MPAYRIRRAVPADAEAWAHCHRACWREVYAPFVDAGLLEAKLADEQGWVRRNRALLESDGPPRWLAEDVEGQAIGLAVAGPARPNVAEFAPLQLYAVYVRQAWWGTGLGQSLLDRAIGSAAATLEVLEDNARARAFYARNGFTETGVRVLYETLGVHEVVLVRDTRTR